MKRLAELIKMYAADVRTEGKKRSDICTNASANFLVLAFPDKPRGILEERAGNRELHIANCRIRFTVWNQTLLD